MSIKTNLHNAESVSNDAFPILTAKPDSLRWLTGKTMKYDGKSTPNFKLQTKAAKSDLLKRRTMVGASLLLVLPWMGGAAWAAIPGGTLDPTTIPKYATPLYVPPAMPKSDSNDPSVDYYNIAARQISQQILPEGMPKTKVWAYGSTDDPKSFHSPSRTIEAKVNRPVQVKWINDLKDKKGNFLPHLLPIDQTVHWANPGGANGPDTMGTDPNPYKGPVPLVTHLHGSHVVPGSDGYPESWTLPAASNIPAGYATRGSNWTQIAGADDQAGAATYQYSNDQRATHMWFHDHTLGMTRSNVYAGLAGNYMVRGGLSDLPSVMLPKGPYEIPLVIQDRSFNSDGSLFYPDNRAFFEGLPKDKVNIPFAPTSDVSPIWNPEFFSNVMLVNGNSWPKLNVEQRRYRFRVLNASDSRAMILKIASDPTARALPPDTTPSALPFWVVGGDGGFLTKPAQVSSLLIGPAERYDVVVDFSNVPIGTPLYLINEGPEDPYGGGIVEVDFAHSDPATTGQVMKFNVVAATSTDKSVPPQQITSLLPAENLGSPTNTRQVSVNEMSSGTVFANYAIDPVTGTPLSITAALSTDPTAVPFGPTVSMLGTMDSIGYSGPWSWMDTVTETPSLGATELWEIYNFTEDAHPIHMHLVEFQVQGREPLSLDPTGVTAQPAVALGGARGPEAWELGSKDTVIAYPGEVTRVKAKFDKAGRYVWHCHILSHEDNDMMRPICVGGQC